MSYHHINRIEDEKRLLEEMLTLQSDIRKRREKNRIENTNKTEKYAKMLEPVTKSLEKFGAKEQVGHDLVEPFGDLGKDDPGELEFDLEKEDKPQPYLEKEPPGELFIEALNAVPARFRDNGLLGFDDFNNRIGNFQYTVNGNTLNVWFNHEHFSYEINDINLWKLLIVSNPNRIDLKTEDENGYLPFVEKYREIASDLHLGEEGGRGMQKRIKYKIIKHKGSGLYTIYPPVNPQTVVLPSDDKGLLQELYIALAELRAGNTSMQNLVVPLAQEAERKGILPNILTNDEKTWVFA